MIPPTHRPWARAARRVRLRRLVLSALLAAASAATGSSLAGGAEPAAAAGSARGEGAQTRAAALRYGTPLPLPPTGRWRFKVYYGEYRSGFEVASLDYGIDHNGESYVLRTEGRAAGLTALLYSGVLNQTSTGRLSRNGLAPEHYWERRGKRPERWARVDYGQRRVSFSGNEPVAMVEGAQDRLSVLVQLGLLARVAPERFAKGTVVQLPEITLRDIELAGYTSRGDETLGTGDGPLRALHIERTSPRDKDDTRIDVWLGYDQQMLPVRIRFTDADGRVLDQILAR